MKSFSEIKKNTKNDYSLFPGLRIAILGNFPTQFFNQSIKGIAFDYKLNLDILEIDYNLIEQTVFNTESELYKFKPNFVIILKSSIKFLNKYNQLNEDTRYDFSDSTIRETKNIIEKINQTVTTQIIINNYNEINDFVYGNYGNKIESSFIFQLRKFNFELMKLSILNVNVNILDLSSIQNQFGRNSIFKPSQYATSELNFDLDSTVIISKNILDIISAKIGNSKKCIVLDLDNTLWGGIIGDDGIENIELGNLGIGKAFTEFQYWLKKLNERGIILAVCSKNDYDTAKNAFINHPDMILKMDNISIFKANWESKSKNIKEIKTSLNISYDSMVFFDDSEYERALIKNQIPEITVPDLPLDPAEYLMYLSNLNLFEIGSISEEDKDRTKFYKQKIDALNSKSEFTNETDFLISLEMKCKVDLFNKYNIPRIQQLSQRSNQFNFRTIRYNELDIKNIIENKSYHAFTFSLSDKFGDHGLVSAIVLKELGNQELFIDNWFMSCRVLKRGLESFILNHIINYAKLKGYKLIIAEYLSTSKNGILKNFFQENNFSFIKNRWELKLNVIPQTNFITQIET